jgi:hypothetical protein
MRREARVRGYDRDPRRARLPNGFALALAAHYSRRLQFGGIKGSYRTGSTWSHGPRESHMRTEFRSLTPRKC